jgi:hypothetical protein
MIVPLPDIPMSSEEKGLSLVAILTLLGMLAGFLLVFLLPYSQVLGWTVFLATEVTICAAIIRKLVDVRGKISESKRSQETKLHP